MKTMVKTVGKKAVHRIAYIDELGNVVDFKDYGNNVRAFASDLNDELKYGVSMCLTYTDDNGNVVHKKLMNDYDCIPKVNFSNVTSHFAKAFERNKEALSKAYEIIDETIVIYR